MSSSLEGYNLADRHAVQALLTSISIGIVLLSKSAWLCELKYSRVIPFVARPSERVSQASRDQASSPCLTANPFLIVFHRQCVRKRNKHPPNYADILYWYVYSVNEMYTC